MSDEKKYIGGEVRLPLERYEELVAAEKMMEALQEEIKQKRKEDDRANEEWYQLRDQFIVLESTESVQSRGFEVTISLRPIPELLEYLGIPQRMPLPLYKQMQEAGPFINRIQIRVATPSAEEEKALRKATLEALGWDENERR